MSDKWWDMSDDELDDLFREASDKVQIPFDQSSLNKLKIKIDPKPVIVPATRFKNERWLLLLLLLCFVGAGIGYYLTKDNVSVKLTGQKNQKENTLNKQKQSVETVKENSEDVFSTKEKTTEKLIAKEHNSIQEKLVEQKSARNTKREEIGITEKQVAKIEEQKTNNESEKLIQKQSNVSFVKHKKTSKPIFNNNNNAPITQKAIEVSPTENTLSNNLASKQTYKLALLSSKPLKALKTNFNITQPTFEESNPEPTVNPIVSTLKNSRFGIRLAIAPDANAVENLGDFAFGKSAGILFEYNLAKRFTLQTGAIYTYKQYTTGIENYHAWAKNWSYRPVLPTSVAGDCKILDIPINIRYNVFMKPKNTWFVSAGVSSYLMLTENYEYYYPESATVPTNFPRNVSWKRDDDYFMSTLNLSFGFEKRINQHIAIQAEPYLKTPLKEVGRGKVNLYSSGILFSLKYGF